MKSNATSHLFLSLWLPTQWLRGEKRAFWVNSLPALFICTMKRSRSFHPILDQVKDHTWPSLFLSVWPSLPHPPCFPSPQLHTVSSSITSHFPGSGWRWRLGDWQTSLPPSSLSLAESSSKAFLWETLLVCMQVLSELKILAWSANQVAERRNQAGRFALGSPGSWWVPGGRLRWRQGWGWGVAASKKDPVSTYLDTAWQNLLTTTLTSISFQHNSFPPQYIQWLQNSFALIFLNFFCGCIGSSFLGIGFLWLQSPASAVVALGLSCSIAHGIFLDQGSKPFALHWQADP